MLHMMIDGHTVRLQLAKWCFNFCLASPVYGMQPLFYPRHALTPLKNLQAPRNTHLACHSSTIIRRERTALAHFISTAGKLDLSNTMLIRPPVGA